LSVILLALLFAGRARGAGFAIYEQGAAATGKACAVTAVADTPSAIFYNPAGLGMQKGLGIEVGDTLIFPGNEHEDPATGEITEAEFNIFYPPTVYASYRFKGRVAFGVGFFVPYGLGMEWPEGWAGYQEIESIELQSYYINPTVAWSPFEWLSVGMGFDMVRSVVTLQKGLNFIDERGTLAGAADAWGFGANAGVLLRFLDDRVGFGIHYRSAVELDLRGRADFTVPPAFEDMLRDQPIETSITLPHHVALGGMVRPHEMVELSLDITFTTWSTFRRFAIGFPRDEERPEDEHLSQSDPRDWSDVFSVRLGLELTPVEGLALRAGFVFDRNPSPRRTMSPSLPDADRVDVSVGAGYAFPCGLSVDLGYMYVHFMERSSTGEAFPGIYRSHAHLLGLGVGYRWSPPPRR
jgi:long-chain fatty acid transport protein